ncbi:TetR/AcrR family transcriptional regulator [Henriciella algicola]|nr:TetR/AcrR family transcriptional regulator [Henriciella algicola]
MARDTREQLLDTAETLFAERGFYGVSIAAIADELGLTKQALLHHFGTKEKLYGEVLKRISDRFDALEDNRDQAPEEVFAAYLRNLNTWSHAQPQQTALLMRELLDNRQRAGSAGTWYLKPFLDRLADKVLALEKWQDATRPQGLAMAYQLLGAINYFSVSGPTLTGIFGSSFYGDLESAHENQLALLIEAAIGSGPPG